MPRKPRLFGTDPVRVTMALVRRWEAAGHPASDPIYRGECSTVFCYRAGLQDRGLDHHLPVLQQVDQFLAEQQQMAAIYSMATPVPPAPQAGTRAEPWRALETLSVSPRSVCDFAPISMPKKLVREAARVAPSRPSACNRQPDKSILIEKRAAIDLYSGSPERRPLLRSQGSIAGGPSSRQYKPFRRIGEKSSLSEWRAVCHEPDVRIAGSGIWRRSVTPATDQSFRKLGHVKDQDTAMMMLATGYQPVTPTLPRSPRRDLGNVIHWSGDERVATHRVPLAGKHIRSTS